MQSVSSFESAYSEDIETKEWKRKTYSYSLKATLLCHPSPTSTNTHAFFSVFLFLFFDLSLPPLLLFLVFLSPKINITYKTQWKKYYYQVIVLGYFCRVIFSKNAHFPTEKLKWKCMQTHRVKKQRTSRSFEVGVFFKKIWIERWN